jgi:hypothetical protein
MATTARFADELIGRMDAVDEAPALASIGTLLR